MKESLGTDILNKFIVNTKEYKNAADSTQQDVIKKKAFDTWMTFLYLKNGDNNKYGTLMDGFR